MGHANARKDASNALERDVPPDFPADACAGRIHGATVDALR
jgi:hypothetical protein